MNQEANSYDQRLAERRERWRDIAVVFVLFAFIAQHLVVWIDPTLLLLTLLFYAITYMSSISSIRGGKQGVLHRIVFFLGLICSVVLSASCLQSFEAARLELKQPCQTLRGKLLAKPHSTDADAYQALKCPFYYTPPWADWLNKMQ